MNQQVIGTCSICGGRVLQHTILHIVGPFPPARCETCGAVEATSGPVIPMRPAPAPRALSDRVSPGNGGFHGVRRNQDGSLDFVYGTTLRAAVPS